MESVRILVALSSEASNAKLKMILVENGYTVTDMAKDGHDALRKTRALRPDLVILDHALSLLNGDEVARVILEDNIGDVILITTDAQKSIMDDAAPDGSFVCMVKPINKLVLINTIELMMKNRRRVQGLEKEIEELRNTLDTRKEVEKAKGLLMRNLNLSEADAFKRIQKQSMDRGIPMKEIAKAIILAYDI
jgi:two-component system, response regulator PdtaR